MRQLAGHSELEHNKNKRRVRADPHREKIILFGEGPVSETSRAVRLESGVSNGVPPAMAPRANWKGFLRLSLVTCPVALYPATSDSEKVSFNQLNRKTGHRIKGGFKRSSQHQLLSLITEDRQAPPPAFSSLVSSAVGH